MDGSEEDENVSGEGSCFAYSTAIHSGNLSFRRTKKRMRLAREHANPRELKRIGLRQMTVDEVDMLPLHKLSSELEKVREKVPLNTQGKPVVPCVLEPYLSCFVGPDHVLFGVGEDISNAMLKMLRPHQREHVNALAMEALTSAGVTVEGSFLSSSVLHINSMSFSSFTAYLLVTPWAMRTAAGLPAPSLSMTESEFFSCSVEVAVLHTLYAFRDLQFATTYMPIETVDGQGAVDGMEEARWATYMGNLQEKATSYVRLVNWLCMRNPVVKREVDKPNVHRLLELYFHSIPRLGHVAMFQELILEGGHQPLKRGIERSNKRAPHIHAMMRMLADDWIRRIGETACGFDDLGNISDAEVRALFRTAFGTTQALDSGQVTSENVRNSFSKVVLQQFCSTANAQITKKGQRAIWVGRTQKSMAVPKQDSIVSSFLRLLLCDQDNQDRFMAYNCAVRAHLKNGQCDEEAMKSRQVLSEHNTLRPGHIIQILLNDDSLQHSSGAEVILLQSSQRQGKVSFWKVMGLYGVIDRPLVYAHVRRMYHVNEGLSFENIYSEVLGDSAKHVLLLNPNTRRALSMHDCIGDGQSSCLFHRRTGVLYHDDDEDEGNTRYVVLGSGQGFPPRSR